MGALSELDAVNRILRAASENPVPSLTNDGVADTDLARSILRETSYELQMMGLAFNTEVKTLHPTSNGTIPAAANMLAIDGAEEDEYLDIVIRGDKLYNRTTGENTFTFTDSIKAQIIWYFEWDQIPTPQQYQIADRAAREYQMLVLGDRNTDAFLARKEALSDIRGTAEDIRTRDHNIIRNNRVAQRIYGRNRRSV